MLFKAEEEEANKMYQEMLKEGQEINSAARSVMKKQPRLFKYSTVSGGGGYKKN